jgi:hypothetical protein
MLKIKALKTAFESEIDGGSLLSIKNATEQGPSA